ncbi:Transmembrane protein [Thalictrum thalictroides]|uniref:Transmembrane protein n=1 Tax=Thalictrum thalictroides TaxID=46969 RepID=A0A7J6WJJ4_THATH|nr:Transmembrane protein [Thalictrum thalictroides]
MGQTMQTLATGRTTDEIGPIIEQCYKTYFGDHPDKVRTMADFYCAICQTVEEINKKIGGTQLRIPSKENLEKAYKPLEKKDDRGLFFWTNHRMVPHKSQQKHHHEGNALTKEEGKGNALTKEEFRKILKEVMFDTGLLGTGAKDIFFFIFSVPMTALLIKQKLGPKAIPNEIFIPGVTSATVFVLARLNKI